MKPRQTTLDGSIRIFAGPSPSDEPSTDHDATDRLEGFRAALARGANGLVATIWSTADGHAVMHDNGRVGSRLRRRRISSVNRSELPNDVCSFDELYGLTGPTTDVSVDLGDTTVFEQVISVTRAAGDGAEERLWIRHPDLQTLAEWRRSTSARLMLSAQIRTMKQSPEQCVATLRERGIDGLSLRHDEWNGGLVALTHRFERYAFGWGLEYDREVAKVVNTGIDGILGSDVSRMVAVAAQFD